MNLSSRHFVTARFQIPEPAFDLFTGALWEVGTLGCEYTELEGHIDVTAFFPQGTRPASVLERLIPWLKSTDGIDLSNTSWDRLDDVDWSSLWHASYRPIEVGDRLAILPAWSRARFPGRFLVKISPRMAFGTGSHESTRLCLNALDRCVREGFRIADVGTGSGILAIAAAKLGATSVHACDVDAVALENARHNVRMNRVVGQVDVFEGDIGSLPEHGRYDMIVANIVPEPIAAQMNDMARRLLPHGLLYASGLLVDQESRMTSAIQEAGLRIKSRAILQEWLMLTLEKPGARNTAGSMP